MPGVPVPGVPPELLPCTYSLITATYFAYSVDTTPNFLFLHSSCLSISVNRSFHLSLSRYVTGDGALFISNSRHKSLVFNPFAHNILDTEFIIFFSTFSYVILSFSKSSYAGMKHAIIILCFSG